MQEKQPRDESRAATVRSGGAEAWTAAGEYIDHDEQLPVSAGSKTPSDRMFTGDQTSAATTAAGGTSQSGTSSASLREPARPIQRRGEDQPAFTASSSSAHSTASSPTGSSFTSSAAPIGEGSNTPVGNEPSDFSSWDARQPDPGTGADSSWSVEQATGMSSTKLGGLLAAGTASTLAYAWWQRRHRKTRMERVRDLLVGVSQQYGAGVPRTLGETVGKSKSPWLPFVLLPLALYLRSQGGKAEKAGDQLLRPLHLEDRGQILARQGASQLETYGRRLIGEVEKRDPTLRNEGWGWTPWLLGLTAAGGAAYAGRQYLGQGASAVQDYAGGFGVGSFGSNGTSSETGGKLVRDVMTRSPETIAPDAKLVDAARQMRDLDIGSLPVYDGKRLIGVVTDRDISVRATAEGKNPGETSVRQVMSSEVAWVFADEPAAMAASVMRQRQIRRLPVLDRDDKLVGIVALGDLATDLPSDAMKGATLEDISQPNRTKR